MTNTWAGRIRTAAAAALLLAAAVACGSGTADGSDGGGGGTELGGRTFEATSIVVDGEARPIVEGTTIAITFDGAVLRASAGCNHLGADVAIGPDQLVVHEVAMTAMGCPTDVMDQDAMLAGLLQADPSWRLEGPTLTLAADGTTMVLIDATDTTPSAGLLDGTWTLDTIVEGETASSVPAGVTALLDFSDDGSVVGRGTCNGYGATFEAGPDTIAFEPGPTTLIACPDPEGPVEDAVRTTLTGTTTYAIDGGQLTITSADGSRALVYRLGR
jgi:heat shock protein HslJ